jgi:meso-butanediol dehydrogenase/(S,S)-butanediol dehydrogenase/diacetyl reductase
MRVALVTGGSRGVGFVVARRLLADGWHVGIVGRGAEALTRAVADLGQGAWGHPADVGDPGAVRALFEEVTRRHDQLDLLVNNAGVAWPATLDEATEAEIVQQLATNLLGPIWMTRAALPLLRRSTRAQVVNVSSESVTDPFPLLSVYAASKAGLETLSAALGNELRRDGIRVATLVAGRTAGGGFSAGWDPSRRQEAMDRWMASGHLARVSGMRSQDPERIAEAVVFLADQPRDSVVDRIFVRAWQEEASGSSPLTSGADRGNRYMIRRSASIEGRIT